MKILGVLLVSALLTTTLNAQTVLIEEDFTNGMPAGWQVIDQDQLTPHADVSNFTEAWIGYTTTTDTCLASTSYYTDGDGQSADYLILPNVSLESFGSLLSWDSRSYDANYPESYVVLVSATGSSISSFTDTVKIVTNDSPYWKTRTINLFNKGYANQNVYVAFRNTSANNYILGLDNIRLTTADPASVNEQSVSVRLYPNPVQNVLKIEAADFISYSIYSVTGQLVKTGNSDTVDVESLNKGHYFIKVETNSGVATKRFVK